MRDKFEMLAAWFGDRGIMPILNGLGWIFDHPIPFALTIGAGIMIGVIAGG